MKALVYSAPHELTIQDFPEPMPGPGEVRVRVAATGICGSDMHGFLGHSARRKPGLVLGHETVGTVAAVGAGVDSALVGRRVAVNPLATCGQCAACAAGRQNVCANWTILGLDRTHGAFAESVCIPARNVHALPDSVTDAQAVMVEPLANAVHLLSLASANAGLFPTIAIFGGGTLGAATLAVARARGMRVAAVVEPNPRRAEVARTLGAETVLVPGDDAVQEISRLGAEMVVDAVGRESARIQAAASVARGGTVILLGLDAGPTTLDFIDLIRREVRLQCSFTYTDADFATAFDLVARGIVDFSAWTTEMPLEQGQAAFERLHGDPGDRIKIALRP